MDDIFGPMTMVRIDGAKIKRLREGQGLTQLYLATAVEVTTDTISRWENRRYPTIKKENALKLAEALNVGLDDLLEAAEENTAAPADPPAVAGLTPSRPRLADPQPWWRRRVPPLVPLRPLPLLAGAALLGLLILFGWLFWPPPTDIVPVVERILPPHSPAGQAFPVLLQVQGEPGRSTALIIKETIPGGATFLASSPASSPVSNAGGGEGNGQSSQSSQLKWLTRISGNSVLAYLLRVDAPTGATVNFSGTAAVGTTSAAPPAIDGASAILLSPHHWADRNRDNVISDDEILAVFDRYGDLVDLDLGMTLIEEIWLSSGYRWNSAAVRFETRGEQ